MTNWGRQYEALREMLQKCHDAAVAKERERVARALSTAANEACSCGGMGPHDPGACPACLFYHRVEHLLGLTS